MPQVTLPEYNPPLEGARSKLVYASVTSSSPIVATEVKIGIGANVPLRRQNEIVNAFRFLLHGIRERRLLEDGGFKGADLITAVNINSITAANRRTASTDAAASVTDDDVFLSMGATATGNDFVVMLDTAVEMMLNVLLENLKDQAA